MTDISVGARPLVGRGDELARLSALTGLNGSGTPGGAVLLAGDAGVGKTRLLGELVSEACATQWRVLQGHCLDFGDSALPYLPFTEVFGDLSAVDPGLVTELAEDLPAVRRLLPHQRVLAGDQEGASALERSELFEAVYRALERLATDKPVLMVVEDVHWADPSTRELLTFLFTRTFSVPVAIVASYRSDDLHRRHPLRRMVAEWARLRGVTRFNLTGLDDAGVRSLIHSLHPGPMPESDVHTIVSRAEGNAFFTEELVGATELSGRSLPDDLAELMLIRLDRLDDDARTAARAAAGAGRRVSYALLARVVDLDAERLELALRQAVEHNVLVATADGYAFRHALLGEAVYEDLLPGERVRLHAAYADALRSREVGGTAADLARHARAAHDLETALRASVEAGDDAMSVGGPAEAAQHYELALDLLAQVEEVGHDSDVIDLIVKAGDSITAAGSPHRAVVVHDQLLQRDAALGATDRVRLLVAVARAALVSDTDVDPLPLTTEALGLLTTDATPLRAQVLGAHALASLDRHRDEEAVRWADEAIEIGNELGLSQVVADARTTLGRLDARTGDPESSKRTLRSVINYARKTDDLTGEMKGLHQLAGVYYEVGDFDTALKKYLAASERATQAGRPWAPYGVDGRVMASISAYVAGDWDEAKRLADVSGDAPPALAEAGLAAAEMQVAAGRGHTKALDLVPSLRPWWYKDGMIAILEGGAEIDLHGDAGDVSASIAAHDAIVEAVGKLQWTWFPARIRLAALVLGQLACHASVASETERHGLVTRVDELIEAADGVLSEADRRGRPMGPEGVAWHRRAHAEALRLRWQVGIDPPTQEDLVGAWRSALEKFEAFGHVFEIARTQSRLASVLRAGGERDEPARLVEQAREVAERLRAAPLLRELDSLVRTPRESSAGGEVALTPRESEILELVAQGRTNGEIGRQLFISVKTVSVHVSNVLAKLGASSRTEAAAIAHRDGLLS
ncbi:MAG: AAA family ATPase [Actinomycetia bacterium]|nr:AAA family ATPase [Actinomycetes bacterium]